MTEDAFFKQLFARLPQLPESVVIGPGDDCAALSLPGDKLLLIAVDQLVAGRHYIAAGPEAPPPQLVGRKLLARNLSDIAAMGGTPRFCLVAHAFPDAEDETHVRELLDGVIALGREFSVYMIGGDLAAVPHGAVSSLTIVGDIDASRVCRRDGARPDQAILATGCFGDANTTGHHLHFSPRCREGAWLAATDQVSAMIDVSDGLLLDLTRICRASRVGAVLDLERVPRRTPTTTVENALSDGEDYELLLTVPHQAVVGIQATWPFPETPLTVIGQTTLPTDPTVTNRDGSPIQGVAGYDHFEHR